jgi:hypothetical protein
MILKNKIYTKINVFLFVLIRCLLTRDHDFFGHKLVTYVKKIFELYVHNVVLVPYVVACH